MKKIILLGGGGFSREVLDTIEEINTHTEESIYPMGILYDEGEKDKEKTIHNIPVLGNLSYLEKIDLTHVFLVAAVGRTVWRRKLVTNAKRYGAKFTKIIHPSSFISKWSQIGEGAIIQRHCGIASGVKIGDFLVANSLVSIGHDTIVNDFVHINPYVTISGNSMVGNDVYIGVKATILNVNIGDGAVIGASALVTKNVPSNIMAKGIPAKHFQMQEKSY